MSPTKSTEWNKRFLASTRGRIVALLRGACCTVSDLAAALELTDNAVRAHLTSLERDGLVQQSGVRRGLRKPHYSYRLTPEAEHLFPKAYGALLNELLSVLQQRLEPEEKEAILREVGHRIAAQYAPRGQTPALDQRIETAIQAFGDLGGLAETEQHNGHLYIRGDSCPLATVVPDHPEMCRLAETVVADIVGLPIRERCVRGGSPQCCFEVMLDAQ